FYPFGNIVDCSYDSAHTETMTINNAQSGEIYMVLLTNFNGSAGFIKLIQTNSGQPGAGSTDCSILCPLSIVGGGVPLCSDPSLTAIYENAENPTFQWYFGDGSGPVAIPGATSATYSPTQEGTYTVEAAAEGCENEPASAVVPPNTPVAFVPVDSYVVCSPLATWNLDSQTPLLLANLNLFDYEVSFHHSQQDAQYVMAPIQNSGAYPGTPGETIWVSIQDNASGGCVTVTSFVIDVETCTSDLDDLYAADTLPNDAQAIFDMTAQVAEALGTLDPADF